MGCSWAPSPALMTLALRTRERKCGAPAAVWRMKDSGPEKDYYTILGAGRDAPREEIERRYKRLAQRHHPDRGGDEEEMKSINEAWRVLGNADARRTYDAGRARPREIYRAHAPVSSPAARADPLSGRLVGAGRSRCVILGRDAELDDLRLFLGSILDGPSALVLEGVAGIGTSRCPVRAVWMP